MYPLERLRKEGRESKGEGRGEKGNGRSKRWEQFPGKNWLPGYAPWGLPLTASFVHLCFGVIEQRDGSNKWLPHAKRLRSRKMSFCSDGVSLKHKNLSIITKKKWTTCFCCLEWVPVPQMQKPCSTISLLPLNTSFQSDSTPFASVVQSLRFLSHSFNECNTYILKGELLERLTQRGLYSPKGCLTLERWGVW